MSKKVKLLVRLNPVVRFMFDGAETVTVYPSGRSARVYDLNLGALSGERYIYELPFAFVGRHMELVLGSGSHMYLIGFVDGPKGGKLTRRVIDSAAPFGDVLECDYAQAL